VPTISAGEGQSGAVKFHLTKDLTTKGAVAIDRGKICPYRQKEVLAALRERLPPGTMVPTSHDIRAINKIYNIPAKEEYCWEPDYSSKQYSDAYVDWIVQSIENNENFISDVREGLWNMEHP
jgi:hypothetical protein